MKNLLSIAFTILSLTAGAQTLTKTSAKVNPICVERGHSITYTPSGAPAKAPYTIDMKDSTVVVYPIPAATGRCSRCGATTDTYEKDIRVTTWRRADAKTEVFSSPAAGYINWGNNPQRGLKKPFQFSYLDENTKVASLRNDTLFIYKRIAPFATIREQIRSKQDTVVYYQGKPIIFKTAVFDDGIAFKGKYGKDFY